MEKLCTAAQMREMDRQAMHGLYAIAPPVLMENAGRAVVVQAAPYIGGWQGKRVAILCGKGNNGGDGFVIGRHLLNDHAHIDVFVLGKAADYSAESQLHLATLHHLESPGRCKLWYYDESAREALRQALAGADVIVDALIGTGFHGQLRQPVAAIADDVNNRHRKHGTPVVAVDIPSGINADTGCASGSGPYSTGDAVHASVTVTFGHRKRGLSLYPGRDYSGIVKVDAIGMPWPLLEQKEEGDVWLPDPSDIGKFLPPRCPDSHKGTYGTIGIVAGSRDMAGAALMACHGAQRSGAGKLCLRTPAGAALYCAGQQPEVMVRGVGQGNYFQEVDAVSIEKECGQWQALAVGPGLGRQAETRAFVKHLLSHTQCPMVLDADALFLLAGERDLVCSQGKRLILTPHLGEFSRLSGMSVSAVQDDVISAARHFADDWQVTLVLKGAATIVASAFSPEIYVNPTGNAGMAAGGMGDVLTGMTASLVGQHRDASLFEAACAAVYLHGAAGDHCCDHIGPYGYSPMEVADAIPAVVKKVMDSIQSTEHQQ